MNKCVFKKDRLLQVILLIIPVFFFHQQELYAQIGLPQPQPPLSVRLFEPEYPGLTNFSNDSLLFKRKPKHFKRIVTLDSAGKFINISESIDDKEFVLPLVIDLENYVILRLDFDRRQLWKKTFRDVISKLQESESGAIELEIPIRIRNETFTRIFGSDRVGLKVTGNISFDLSGRSEERSGAATTASQNQGSFSPRFSQTQQFTIEGKIGEKVTVSVEQNSEATFDFENTIKIRYNGDDDEIIQSIEAGNIGLSLPSTKYLVFGGSNKGLFGIKTKMQVGDFHFTGIASLEKGEQQKLTISGGASESKNTVRDYEFIKNRYFFVDDYYVNRFEKGWTEDLSNWVYEPEKQIIDIDVYISALNNDPEKKAGIAVLNPLDYQNLNLTVNNLSDSAYTPVAGKLENRFFARLKSDKYTYSDTRGFITLNQTLSDNQVLAIAYKTTTQKIGTMFEDLIDDSVAVVLRLIKPQNMKPNDFETWPLMMRNVYSLGGSNIQPEGFDIRIEYNLNSDHETVQQVDPKETFLYLMGLDRKDQNGSVVEGGDKVIDDNNLIINRGDGILIFPSLHPFEPVIGGAFEIDTSNFVDIYNTITQSNLTQATKFDMIVTSKSTKSTFNLGFNILEGSEEVLLNGVPLVRDKDYLIDYFTGSLTLLSPEAKRSSANLEIKYEKATIFQLDKKTIFGGRAEYRFWEDSFIGFTALYMNKTTLDQRVRVGQEPFSNFVWDINAALKFKPKFITKAIDALPLVETNAPSTLNIETEFAQVLPNPNTLDNESTGDNNGVAYIDDYESAKRTTPLGIRYLTWTPASPPAKFDNLGEVNDLNAFNAKGNIVWFNPFDKVDITDIWPNRDVNAQTGRTTDILACQVWRDENQDPDSAWAGIMRSTYSFANQEKTKFIEFWVKSDTSFKGDMHIDIGRISEDWWLKGINHNEQSSRGNLNTEDKNSNGILDDGEDTGVDGVLSEPADWPDDRWAQPARQNAVYDGINGTEGNSQARGTSYPDSEDLDGDGQASLVNQYYEYSLSLDLDDPESLKWRSGKTVGKNGKIKWRQFRIPIRAYQDSVGSPDKALQQVYFFRVWFSGLGTERSTIYFATMDFVGNEWEEQGIAESDTSNKFIKNDSLFSVSVYNTEENAKADASTGFEGYHSPSGVAGVKDRITLATSKEQSLVYNLVDLKPKEVAEAKKTLHGNVLSLVNYKRLKMFVHGDQLLPDSPGIDASDIELYIKFGSDNNNYYEYGQRIYAHWHSENEVDINLDEMTRAKDEDNQRKNFDDTVDRYYQAVGKPSMRTIRYFKVGIRNKGDSDSFTGEIWLDEMRVSGVRQESGTALRLRTSLKAADLFTFNAEWESKDADFHDIKTQFGSGSTTESQSYSGKLNFDKFLPENWNMSVQVDGSARFNKKIPKYIPTTDILTHYRNDTFSDKLKSLIGLKKLDSKLESKVNFQKNYGIGTTIKKRNKSDIWYLRYSIDQLTYDFDYSYSHSRTYQTEFKIAKRYKQSLSYSIPYGKDNYFKPFGFFGNKPIINELSEQKLYYTPNSTSMDLTVNDNKTKQKRRDETKIDNNVTANSTRSVKIGYKLLPSVNMNYSRQHKASADFVGLKGNKLLESIFTKFYFGKETNINQNFQMNYKPKIISWLTTDYSYNATFQYDFINLKKNQKRSTNKTTKKVTFSFSPSQIANMIYSPVKSSSTKQSAKQRGRGRRQSKKKEPSGGENKGAKKDDEKPEDSKKEDDKTEGAKKDDEKPEDGKKEDDKTEGAKKDDEKPEDGKKEDDKTEGAKKDDEKPEDGKKEDEKKVNEKKSGEAAIKIPNPLLLFYTFFNAWKNIQLNYTWDENVSNAYVSSIPSWKYQFGLTQDPNVEQDTEFTGGSPIGPSTSDKRALRTSLSFDVIKNIKTTFKHEWSNTETSSDKSRSGNEAVTFLAWGEDPMEEFEGIASDFRRLIPDWTIKISGVEKFLFFGEFAKTMSIDHGRSGKYTENKKLVGVDLIPNSQSFTHNYQPLIGVNISWLWGMSSNIRITESANYNFTTSGGATKSNTSSFTISASYATSGGFKIPIPIWPFKGKTFKNEMNITLTYDQSTNVTYQRQSGQSSFQENQKNGSWKLRPSATYRFNKRVSGSLFYEMGATENKISGKYSYNEFGITCNIAIRD